MIQFKPMGVDGEECGDLQVLYYDLLSTGDTVQDYFMVSEVQKDQPHIKKIVLQFDNANCYQSAELLLGIALLNSRSLIEIVQLVLLNLGYHEVVLHCVACRQ